MTFRIRNSDSRTFDEDFGPVPLLAADRRRDLAKRGEKGKVGLLGVVFDSSFKAVGRQRKKTKGREGEDGYVADHQYHAFGDPERRG